MWIVVGSDSVGDSLGRSIALFMLDDE